MASASAEGGIVEGQRLRREQAVVRRSECQDVESSSDAPEDPTHSELNVLLDGNFSNDFALAVRSEDHKSMRTKKKEWITRYCTRNDGPNS